MSRRVFATILLGAGTLCAQHRFSWQDYCFEHSSAPFCPGNDFAIKAQPPTKDPQSRNVIRGSAPSASIRTASPSLIRIRGIDWRFADPSADALVGFNFGGIAASPLAHDLIAELARTHGLTDAEMERVFSGLSGIDQVALSVRDNRLVAMVTGSVTDSGLLAAAPELKSLPLVGGAMLMGHADVVDQAARRVNANFPPSDLAQLATELQASSDFWAIGPGRLLGPLGTRDGVKQFSIALYIRERTSCDVTLEFSATPTAKQIQTWQATLGGATVTGNTVHFATSLEADEARRKFHDIATGTLGQSLAGLVEAARYLPAKETAPKHTKPVIYGLDDGPKEVNQ